MKKLIPTPTLVWILVFTLAGIWGSSYLVLKKALVVFTPLQVIAGRMFFASIFLLPFALREIKNIPRQKWGSLIFFAIITNLCVTYLNALAQSQITSSLNGIFSALTPLMTLVLGLVFYRQTFKPIQLLGLLIGLIGTLILVFYAPGNELGAINLFALIAVLATLCTGLSGNIVKFNLSDLSSVQISSIAFLIVFPLAAFYVWQSDFFILGLESSEGRWALGEILFLAFFANVIAILIFTWLIEISSPVFATLVTYLVPIVALGWGLWDGEVVNLSQLMGMGIIISSVWLVGRTID